MQAAATAIAAEAAAGSAAAAAAAAGVLASLSDCCCCCGAGVFAAWLQLQCTSTVSASSVHPAPSCGTAANVNLGQAGCHSARGDLRAAGDQPNWTIAEPPLGAKRSAGGSFESIRRRCSVCPAPLQWESN